MAGTISKDFSAIRIHAKTERWEEDEVIKKKCQNIFFSLPVSHISYDIFWKQSTYCLWLILWLLPRMCRLDLGFTMLLLRQRNAGLCHELLYCSEITIWKYLRDSEGEKKKWPRLKRKADKGTVWNMKKGGLYVKGGWTRERSASICVPWGQSLRGKAYNGMR